MSVLVQAQRSLRKVGDRLAGEGTYVRSTVHTVAIHMSIHFASRVCRDSIILLSQYEYLMIQTKIPSWRDAHLSNYFRISPCCRKLPGKAGIFARLRGSIFSTRQNMVERIQSFRWLHSQHGGIIRWHPIREASIPSRVIPFLRLGVSRFRLVCAEPVMGKLLFCSDALGAIVFWS